MKLLLTFSTFVFSTRQDGRFQLKVDDTDNWSAKCITLQTFHKPGGYNILLNDFDTTLPSAVLQNCDSNNENQWFAFNSQSQLEANGNCLSFAQPLLPANSDSCGEIVNTEPNVGSQLYTTECMLEAPTEQQFTITNGMISACSGAWVVGAKEAIDDVPRVAESLTVPMNLIHLTESNTLGLLPFTGFSDVGFHVNTDPKLGRLEILDFFLGRDHQLQYHGCHCSSLDNPEIFSGHGAAVDAIDQVCKEWSQIRKCNSFMEGGSCFNQQISSVYQVNVGSLDKCDLNTESCVQDICKIDLKYAQMIETIFDSDHVIIAGNQDICEVLPGFFSAKRCEGTAPDLSIINVENANQL